PRDRGRMPQVVCLRFEGQARDAELLSPQAAVAAEVRLRLLREQSLLPIVHRVHRRKQREIKAMAAGGGDERLHVLGKTAPAVAAAGEEELLADALVGAH